MAIQHELSWSASRAGTFATCKRKYYYDYYLSWLGWNASAPAERRQAYLLKKMTRMPMLAGDLVHQAIERWLKGKAQGKTLSYEELFEFVASSLRDGYKTSRDGMWKARPSKLIHLAEHHYHEGHVDEKDGSAGAYGKRYLARMETSLKGFLELDDLAEARSVPGDLHLGCEEMSTFELFGTKIYAIPDFAFRDDEGQVHVYDWKTGRPNERDAFQLAVYVEYAVAKWNADPDRVICYDAYLGEGSVVRMDSDEIGRAKILERIRVSMDAMAAVHFDADRGVGAAGDFPKIEPGRICGSCNYREMCDR